MIRHILRILLADHGASTCREPSWRPKYDNASIINKLVLLYSSTVVNFECIYW